MKNRVYRWIAYRLPRKVVYWAVIRAGAHATTGKYNTTEVTAITTMEVLQRWEKKNTQPNTAS